MIVFNADEQGWVGQGKADTDSNETRQHETERAGTNIHRLLRQTQEQT